MNWYVLDMANEDESHYCEDYVQANTIDDAKTFAPELVQDSGCTHLRSIRPATASETISLNKEYA